MGGGGYILAGGGRWWVVVDIFCLVVGSGGWWHTQFSLTKLSTDKNLIYDAQCWYIGDFNF